MIIYFYHFYMLIQDSDIRKVMSNIFGENKRFNQNLHIVSTLHYVILGKPAFKIPASEKYYCLLYLGETPSEYQQFVQEHLGPDYQCV